MLARENGGTLKSHCVTAAFLYKSVLFTNQYLLQNGIVYISLPVILGITALGCVCFAQRLS